MKKIFIILFLFFFAGTANAEQYDYKIELSPEKFKRKMEYNPGLHAIVTNNSGTTDPGVDQIYSATFSGGGLNDASSGGTFAGTDDELYEIVIDGAGTPDTFKWRKLCRDNVDCPFLEGINITGAAQALSEGVTVTFAATTGHTFNDEWSIFAHKGKTYAYMYWADTTSGFLKQRNAANDAWISLWNLSTGAGTSGITDHGLLSGLADDDHTQYHTDGRGDARYFQQSEFLNSSAGAGDAGKPVKLNASGLIDPTMVTGGSGDPDQNLFETIVGDSGTNLVADGITDTLNILGGTGLDTVGTAASDTLTLNITAGGVGTTELGGSAVTYPKIQNVTATDRVLGRDTAGAGQVEEISPTALRTMINVENGATADQSNAEIKTAYEANADTNEFSDAEQTKLAGIETAATADQTTEEIQDIAGPLIATGGTKTRISATYQDATGDFDLVVDDMNQTECSSLGCILNSGTTAVDEAYNATTWNGNNEIATKNAIRDKIEALPGGHAAVTFSGTGTYISLTGQDIQVDPITESDISDLSHNATAITDGLIIEPDLDADVTAVDGDYLQYDSTGTNFTWRSASEVLSDIGAEPAGITESDISDLTHTTDTTLSLAGVETITGNWVNTANPWADNEVVDTITAINYLLLSGGALTGELVIDELGIEAQPTDAITDCSSFAATGGGIFYDDSEGAFKKCQDNVLSVLDTTGGTPATADISDVSVTQTEFAELETIGATTISANQWVALGGIAETLTSTELNLLDGITTLSGSNTGDDDVPESGDFGNAVDLESTGAISANAVALGTDTTGGYAASVSEAGPATTATALAANGSNCASGSYPLGVDASGASENCTDVTTEIDAAILLKPEHICVAFGDETTAITTGTAKFTFRMPYAFTLTDIRGSLTTVSSSGSPIFDVNETGTSIMTTNKILIDVSEKTSETAVTAATLTDTALADDAEITVDIDTAGTGATGPKLCLIGHQ